MKLYIDTSVISFWYDRKPHNVQKRRAVRRVLLLCREGMHEGYVSLVTLQELEASREPYRTRDLELVKRLGLRGLPFEEKAYVSLFEAYKQAPLLRSLPPGDLRHLAVYSVTGLDAILTCNLLDLTNQVILDAVRKVNHAQGIVKEIRTGTPEAFIPPDPSV